MHRRFFKKAKGGDRSGLRALGLAAMGIVVILFYGSVALAGEAVEGAASSKSRPPKHLARSIELPELPPLTTVELVDKTQETWEIMGSFAGGPAVAERDCRACFTRQGWRLEKVIPISRAPKPSSTLYLWRKKSTDILVILFERGPGRTSFGLGRQQTPSEVKLSRGGELRKKNSTKLKEAH